LASSAIAATGWLAIPPTLHTSAFVECTTKSGGESGWEPGAPGPGGVRFSIVTRQTFVSSSPAPALAVRSPAAATATPTRARNCFMLSPLLVAAKTLRRRACAELTALLHDS
jgi:hypothetical protein